MYINHMFHVLSRKCDRNMKRIKSIVLHRLMLMFKLEDVWSCHTRGKRLSSYSQIPRNCAAFDTNKEENPIDPTSSGTTSSDGLFCSSLLLQNLVCIVHRISLLPMGQVWATIKVGFARKHPGHATGWTILAIRYGWGRCGRLMARQYLTFIISDQRKFKRSNHNMPANLRASSPSAFLPSSASTCPSIHHQKPTDCPRLPTSFDGLKR